MKATQIKRTFAPWLFALGVIAIVGGAVDPLEGSPVILAGTSLITLSRWLGGTGRELAIYWTVLLGLILFGIAAMFVLSSLGGLGGKHGVSAWWGLLLLPYPVGWILAIANLISRLIERGRRHSAKTPK